MAKDFEYLAVYLYTTNSSIWIIFDGLVDINLDQVPLWTIACSKIQNGGRLNLNKQSTFYFPNDLNEINSRK